MDIGSMLAAHSGILLSHEKWGGGSGAQTFPLVTHKCITLCSKGISGPSPTISLGLYFPLGSPPLMSIGNKPFFLLILFIILICRPQLLNLRGYRKSGSPLIGRLIQWKSMHLSGEVGTVLQEHFLGPPTPTRR